MFAAAKGMPAVVEQLLGRARMFKLVMKWANPRFSWLQTRITLLSR